MAIYSCDSHDAVVVHVGMYCPLCEAEDRIKELEIENEKLKDEIKDLQS